MVGKYIDVFKEECPIEAQDNIVLVGTKLDDVENRKVSEADAIAISKNYECIGYYETSSQTGVGVDEAFFAVARQAFQKGLDVTMSRKRSCFSGQEDDMSTVPEERSWSMA